MKKKTCKNVQDFQANQLDKSQQLQLKGGDGDNDTSSFIGIEEVING